MPLLARRETFALTAAVAAASTLPARAEQPRTISPVRVRGVTIGEGRTKAMVSITEKTRDAVLARARLLGGMAEVDLVEFRLDHLAAPEPTAVAGMLPAVADAIKGKPLVITFRTKEEGGEKALTPAAYTALYEAVLASGAGDLFDVQSALLDHPQVRAMQAHVQGAGRRVILSSHDFHSTPSVAAMVQRLRHQQTLGGDICKIAVMPHDPADVLRLLEATWTMRHDHADRPVFTMAMGGVGTVSRLAGETFGSAISVGSVGTSSAPGQVEVAQLRATIDSVHEALKA